MMTGNRIVAAPARRWRGLASAAALLAAAALGAPPEKRVFVDRYEGVIRVACVGDGVTYGDGLPEREKNCYPHFLQSLLGDRFQVENFGVSGATALRRGDKPYVEQKAFADAAAFAPHLVFLLLGAHDSKPQNWRHGAEFENDLEFLATQLWASPTKPRVYFCLPPPAFEDRDGIRERVLRSEIAPKIARVARKLDAPLLDVYAAMKKREKQFPDKIHPNAYGAALLAQFLRYEIIPHD